MSATLSTLLPHPEGEQPSVEEFSATAETFAGRVHVEWDSDGLVTPLGQLPFFWCMSEIWRMGASEIRYRPASQ